jgi:hypothetical protein
MKNNVRWMNPFLLALCFIVLCCATDRAAIELVNYVNHGILNIAELERESYKRYAAVTGENYTTNQRVYEALKDDVIPLYKRFLDSLRKIRPENEELKNLHRMYMQGAELLYTGFKEKMFALEKEDENLIRSANEKIEKGGIEIERWRNELRVLLEKHGVGEKGKKG